MMTFDFAPVVKGGYKRFLMLPACIGLVMVIALHVLGYLPSLTAAEALLSAAQYLPAALVLCALYERTDSIFAPMLLHGAVNLINCIVIRTMGG